MTRLSNDDFDSDGVLRNGYDYDRQVWVVDYIFQDVGLGQGQFFGKDIRDLERKNR